MKLISENKQEDRLLQGLVLFLQDLNLDVIGHTSRDALALTYWTTQDLPSFLSLDERESFLKSIEEDLYAAMIIAGYETIEKHLARSYGNSSQDNFLDQI